MQNEKGTKTTIIPKDDSQQVIYMMPHPESAEDEIDLWQLLLPFVRYKVQILIFLVLGIILGTGIPLFFGKTVYQNSIFYQYQDISDISNISSFKSRDELSSEYYYPDRDFFSMAELDLSYSLLQQYWNIDFGKTLQKQQESLKKSESFFFSDCKECGVGAEVTVTTDSPALTLETLHQIDLYFRTRNQQLITKQVELQLKNLGRKKTTLLLTTISSLETISPIQFQKKNEFDLYYFEDKKIYLIAEQVQGGVKIIKTKNKRLGNLHLSALLNSSSKKSEPIDAKDIVSRLNKLLSTFQMKSDERSRKISERRFSTFKLHILQSQVDNGNHGDAANIEALELQEKTLSQAIGELGTEINQLRAKIRLSSSILNQAFYLKELLNEQPENSWIEFLNLRQQQQQQQPDRETDKKTDKKPDQNKAVSEYMFNIIDIGAYEIELNQLNQEIIQNKILLKVSREGLISPFKLIQGPKIESMERKFTLQFFQDKDVEETKAMTIEDIKPVRTSKKILLISFALALFLGILTVIIRIFMQKIKSQENLRRQKQDFMEALRFWRL